METRKFLFATPYYVLMDRKIPFGPGVHDPILDIDYSAIFGFSDKATYDTFCRDNPSRLTPYPLVKGYLRNQLDTSGDNDAIRRCVKLVILDASGPREPYVHAATMRSVLEAQETSATHVSASQHLTFHPETHAYRVEETDRYPAALDYLATE